jgi:putative nucleotidyltransferase with HDIG domain
MSTPLSTNAAHVLRLADVVEKIERLPVLPGVVTDLLQSIDREDLDLGTLAKKIGHDQALTAKTLRIANSTFYGGSGKITTMPQAISVLGMKKVRNLITAAALSACFADNRCTGFDFDAFWRHALATAVCARVLARHLHLNQDFAFTAGLLHDIGRLVLVTCFPQHYEQVLAYRAAHDCYLLDAERSVLGIDHVAAGHALGEQWHFTPVIQHAINGHHVPDAMGGGSIASLINVADAIVHALDLAGADDDMVPPVSLAAWHGIGLDADCYMLIFRETELEFEQSSVVL